MLLKENVAPGCLEEEVEIELNSGQQSRLPVNQETCSGFREKVLRIITLLYFFPQDS